MSNQEMSFVERLIMLAGDVQTESCGSHALRPELTPQYNL